MKKSIQSRGFGACLQKLRDRHNLPQKVLAIEAGMDQSYVAGLEAGRRSPPREKQLMRLVHALKATPEEQQELREAHALSRLVDAVEELNPERGKALAALAHHLQNLSLDELKIIETMASMLDHRVLQPEIRRLS